jgi:putative transposase
MGLAALREKQLIRWRDRVMQLDGRMADGSWHLTDVGTGLMDKQSETDIWSALERGELAFVTSEAPAIHQPTRDLLSKLSVAATTGLRSSIEKDEAGTDAVKRLRYVDSMKGLARSQREEEIDRIWTELRWPDQRPAYATVMWWQTRANQAKDRVAALRDRSDRKGRTGPRYSEDVLRILRQIRDDRFLCRSPRITVEKAVRMAQDAVRIANASLPKSKHMPSPGRKAMVGVINELDAVEVIARRFGADVALRMMRTSLGGVVTSRPLERVEIDHTKLSVVLLDDDFEPLGRASYTGAIDAHTTSMLGYYWGAEVPSVVALARCIRHSVRPKVEFLKKYENVTNGWDCFGVAEAWVLDNGLEEHATAVRQAASQMGVQRVEFCARAAPWQKGSIERFLRTQDQGLLHSLPGATMESILSRTDFDPKKDHLIRASTFDRLLAKWVVDIYMREPKAVLRNRSASDAWAAAKGSFTQYVPTEIDLLERIFLKQVKGRLLDHAGVEYDCLVYNSLDMKLLRERFGPRLTVDIRVSDEELGFIHVGVPNHDAWVKVPCVDQQYAAGMTRWQHGKCKLMRRACADEAKVLSLAEARQQLLDDIEAEKGAVKQGRKMARRRMQEGSHRPEAGSRTSAPAQMAGSEPDTGHVAGGREKHESEIPDFETEVLEAEGEE